METLISVIMPVYNQEKFLDETIESVINQEYKIFEFLILDDGSTDGSQDIIKKFALKDERIKPFFETNKGKCISTNILVERAKGEWCAFLDADDVMYPNRLHDQIAFHKNNPEIDASSCHCDYINEEGKFLGPQKFRFLKNIEDCKNILKKNEVAIAAFTGLMTSRSCYLRAGGLRSQFWPSEDVEFFNRLIEKGFIMVVIQHALMKYRIHASSITSKKRWHTFVNVYGYVQHCIYLRRSNQPEIKFEEFLAIRKNDTLWVKFIRLTSYYSKMFHREAGYSFYSKNYTKFFFQFLVSVILDPLFVWATLRNKLKVKRK
ncbi:glycosyltransferase family 2 protein [Cyclobacterium salsum]|uniref:glycosyltransferase family 2 protein n=1 Tax=Cyclobacterium salsum TaxID=2666329 RepID=UPI00139108ED|nr:glycosyltransferase family 2 protein [Cyclobacterium salsum]